jgi:uncharacterized protein (DUF1499 family)
VSAFGVSPKVVWDGLRRAFSFFLVLSARFASARWLNISDSWWTVSVSASSDPKHDLPQAFGLGTDLEASSGTGPSSSGANLFRARFRRVVIRLGLLVVGLSIAAIGIGRFVSSRAAVPSDVGIAADGFLHGCGERKNCVRSIYIEGGASPANWEAWQASWSYSGDETEAMDRVAKLVTSAGGTIRVRKPAYLAAVFTSAVFGFPDDVEFSIDPTHNDIAWRSASRLGKADLEVNANRMSKLFSQWEQR